jgi:glycosyltransferase involved in cell wall biosynthesis
MQTKIIVIQNIISPYRVPMYNEAYSHFGENILFLFSKETDHYRKWDVHKDMKPKFKYEIINSSVIKLTNWAIHIPINLFTLLRKYNPEVIVVAGYSFQTIFTLLYAFFYRKNIILWTAETKETSKYYGFLRRLLRNIIHKRANSFLVAGKTSHNYVRSFDPIKPIFSLNYSIDPALIHLEKHSEAKKKVISGKTIRLLSVGYLEERKGLQYIIPIIHKLQNNGIHVSLDIVGTGSYEKELKTLALKKDHIIFWGHVPYDQLHTHYSQADIFILPTKKDVWGLVVNEAMMFGLPIITTTSAGCHLDLVNKNNGLVYELGEELKVELFIKKIINNKIDIKEFGLNSKAVIAPFNTQNTSNAFISAIESQLALAETRKNTI